MSDAESAIKAALDSGTWREKTDQNTGRKYYVNVKTKQSVWNLAKELAKGGGNKSGKRTDSAAKDRTDDGAAAAGSPASRVSTAKMVDERHERARKWQEEEAQLQQYIMSLEQEKMKLESEISAMRGPVEAEAAALDEEYAILNDAKTSLEAAVSDALQKRTQATTELRKQLNLIEQLERDKQHELFALESLKKRHTQLTEEKKELASDLLREQQTRSNLNEAYATEQRRLKDVLSEEERQKRLLVRREAEVARAREELIELSKRKAEREAYYEELQQQLIEEEENMELYEAELGGIREMGSMNDSARLEMRHLSSTVTPHTVAAAKSRQGSGQLVRVKSASFCGGVLTTTAATAAGVQGAKDDEVLLAKLERRVEGKRQELIKRHADEDRLREMEDNAFQADALRRITSGAARDTNLIVEMSRELEKCAAHSVEMIQEYEKQLRAVEEEFRLRGVL